MAEKGQDTSEGAEPQGTEEATPSPEKMENGSAQPESPVKKEKKPGMMRAFRESIRRVGERTPLASNIRGSKEKLGPESGMEGNTPERGPKTPASPSLSSGSPVVSPAQATASFFKKEGESADASPQDHRTAGHSRTQSDPTAIMGDTVLKKGAALRHSLRFGSKKDKGNKQAPLQPVTETLSEKIPETGNLEVEDAYQLPEIPVTPLSVMQINKLIENEVFEEAHLNLLSLREELRRDQEECDADQTTMEQAKKEKDLNLLYSALREKVKDIVRDSNKLISRNKELLVHVARIIQEEEKREEDPGAMIKGWRDIWRAAVQEGVQAKIDSVHLDSREQNGAWLAVHLGLLGKTIVEDLENVKHELKGSYPPSFNVFPTYVGCYHKAIGQHIEKICTKHNLDTKDCYAVLDWIINRYESEKILGSPTLQPDMKTDEQKALFLENSFLDQLKKTYCDHVQDDLRTCLQKTISLQSEEMWRERKRPELEEDFYHSEMHMDIMTVIKSFIVNSSRIDANLEKRVVSACSTELKGFPQSFETEFRQWCDTSTDLSLKATYQIAYINSFTILREQMEAYRESSPLQVEALGKEMKAVVDRLGQSLLEQFKTEIRPFLRRMMTRKWLSTDEDFQQIVKSTTNLSQLCRGMKPPYVQEFVNKVHYHVVKEYVSQLMKNNYSCKNRKHEKAASKIRGQWEELQDLFEELKSTSDWLHPVGEHLCNIIGEKNKKEIKNNLADLVKDYPDISKKHLSAVLYFRGMMRGRERQVILRRLGELKRSQGDAGDKSRALFSDMQVTINTDCLASVPLFCLPPFSSDN